MASIDDRGDTHGERETVLLVDHQGLHRLSPDEVRARLAPAPAPAPAAFWVHGELREGLAAMLEDYGLHELAVKSLRDGPERPRVEYFPDHVYVSMLRVRETVGRPDDEGRVIAVEDVRVFLGERWIVSVGGLDDGEAEALAGVIQRQVIARGRGPSFALYYLAEWAVSTLYPVLDGLDDRVDALEDLVLQDTGEDTRQKLFRLKRDLVELRRQVAPMRDVMQRLSAHGSDLLDPGAELFFRDVHDDALLVLEQLDTHREILSSALDLHLSTVSNRLNEVMKRLTVFATIFMPLTFVTGLFGMNFVDLPVQSSAWFWLTLASMVALAAAMVAYAWRRRWL